MLCGLDGEYFSHFYSEQIQMPPTNSEAWLPYVQMYAGLHGIRIQT
jgi:hypothetical protein